MGGSGRKRAQVQRPGPHLAGNIKTDLGGRNALLSDHFYYFGDNAIYLPDHLVAIAQNRQGHRVKLNAPYATPFIEWIEGLGHAPCTLQGQPLMSGGEQLNKLWCASCRADDDEQDDEVEVPTVRTLC